MRNVTRILLIASLAFVSAIIAGCGGGGGGGGGTQPPPSGFAISGTILDVNTHNPVRGAVVTIGSSTSTSNSQGQVSFNLSSAPTVSTYSVALANATPDVYTWWISANDVAQHPTSVILPSGHSLGTIYAARTEDAPPPPLVD